jgi:hypothetical protein
MMNDANHNCLNVTDLQAWAGRHPDYCSSANFLDPGYQRHYETVAEFMLEFESAPVWLNLCVRWDIEPNDEDDGHHARLALLQQRKGIFFPILIRRVEESDVPRLEAYLLRHWSYLLEIWEPLSDLLVPRVL